MTASEKSKDGAFQLVTLNMEEKKVEVNEDALGCLEKRLKEVGARKVAIISVMGAFRTGKSFLLDLFLRYLRHEGQASGDGCTETRSRAEVPERGGNDEYPLPEWLTSAGTTIEGGSDSDDGFRFKGGMDHCTEGIWVWSEPFLRKVHGETVALLLMDTQGAWDGNMTKEQSATIFGLTALISSKQIYNINMQIQEDKVENLAYFMRFAQAALRKAMQSSKSCATSEVEKPFQSLDFLVRDWANFEDEWTVAQCKDQMEKHLDKHVNPSKVVENSTAEAMQSMFGRLRCFCLPHPGLKIQKAAWTGTVSDIDRDFVRFLDEYVHEVFSEGLAVKQILGSHLSTVSFPLVLRTFVRAFQDAAPAAMSFTQAMQSATVLLAKEQAMKSYTKKMDEAAGKSKRGIEPKTFEELHRSFSNDVEEEYKGVTILGDDAARDNAWNSIQDNLATLYKQYMEENNRRLEKALVAFGNVALVALVLFVLDRISDWTCDWWSQTCKDLSRLMFMAYGGVIAYIGFHVYMLYTERGGFAASAASMELWKEVLRLFGVYGDLAKEVKFSDLPDISRKAVASTKEAYDSAMSAAKDTARTGTETKKQK